MVTGLEEGWDKSFTQIKYDDPDWDYIQNLKYNTGVFDAFKNHKQALEIQKLLIDQGKKVSFKEFKAKALEISSNYNKLWLQTEYNHANQGARMAKRWRAFENNSDLYPNLQYITVQDEHTRASHRALHGKIYPINHSFWDTYYPPNGYGCRCTARPTDKDADEDFPRSLPDIPEGMRNNIGKTAKIFDSSHPYYKDANKSTQKEIINFVRQNIRPAAEVKKSYDLFISYKGDKIYFNGSTGGYNVANKSHHFDKLGGKYELDAGKLLANQGKKVEFLAEGDNNRIDIKMDGVKWEIKGTKASTSRAIKDHIHSAIKKGAERVIFYFNDVTDLEVLKKGIGRYININGSKGLPNVYYFNDDDILIKLL